MEFKISAVEFCNAGPQIDFLAAWKKQLTKYGCALVLPFTTSTPGGERMLLVQIQKVQRQVFLMMQTLLWPVEKANGGRA